MTRLTSLPLELLFEIAGYLPKRDIITLALQVLNKTIYTACQPRLQRIAAMKRHEKIMKSRFHTRLEGWPQITEIHYKKAGMENKYGPWVANNNPDASFLEPFDGSLNWLPQPQDGDQGHGKKEMRIYQDDVDRARQLIQQATELGARIPPGFTKLMTTPALGWKIVNYDDKYFASDERLRKILPMSSPGEDAYVLSFLTDQETYGWWSLYLRVGPEKEHFVFHSTIDPRYGESVENLTIEYDDQERKELEDVIAEGKATPTLVGKLDLQICSFDFEEWLCNFFISNQTLCENLPFDAVTEEYVRRNFSSSAL